VKLRIRGNSVRLRLTRPEVAELADGRAVIESVHFSPTSRLQYAVTSDAQLRAPRAIFANDCLTVSLPKDDVLRWHGSEAVSLRGSQALAGGDSLSILVEKDFPCLVPREGEDESGAFARTPGAPACSD